MCRILQSQEALQAPTKQCVIFTNHLLTIGYNLEATGRAGQRIWPGKCNFRVKKRGRTTCELDPLLSLFSTNDPCRFFSGNGTFNSHS